MSDTVLTSIDILFRLHMNSVLTRAFKPRYPYGSATFSNAGVHCSTHPFTIQRRSCLCRFLKNSVITVSITFSILFTPNSFYVLWSTQLPLLLFSVLYRSFRDVNHASVSNVSWIFFLQSPSERLRMAWAVERLAFHLAGYRPTFTRVPLERNDNDRILRSIILHH